VLTRSIVVEAGTVRGVESGFWHDHGDEITAAITIAVTIALAFAVDRLVLGRARNVADRLSESGVSRGTKTRLQVVRRLVFVVILAIGIALALSQFGSIRRLATAILASGALLGLIVGFAARQTIANMVAGLIVAIAQPLRIGDRVTFEDKTGRVDDVTLSYTYIDTGDGQLMVVPNEQVVSSVIYNHSTGDQAAPVEASVWLGPDGDVAAARKALEPAGCVSVTVAEITPDGVRLLVGLRERALRALREAGLLPHERPPR
jgi:small-conductance mechanosensitive channel